MILPKYQPTTNSKTLLVYTLAYDVKFTTKYLGEIRYSNNEPLNYIYKYLESHGLLTLFTIFWENEIYGKFGKSLNGLIRVVFPKAENVIRIDQC